MRALIAFVRRVAGWLGWTPTSYVLMSLFMATLFVIGVVWWPLVQANLALIDWSRPLLPQLDWLLFGIFLAMSFLIMAGADLKADATIVFVGLIGGLVIESWGTQTDLWRYFTNERPPLWIIPAWPVASLSIDRLYRFLDRLAPDSPRVYTIVHWIILPAFLILMWQFVYPTLDKSLTVMALILCIFLTLTPTDTRAIVLTFIAGAGLGYFLELWGTTRMCWVYYTREQPPLFAVLAHGMAAVAFWRTAQLVKLFLNKGVAWWNAQRPAQKISEF